MADEVIKIKIETTGTEDISENINKTAEATKNLKTQLKEAKTELQNMVATQMDSKSIELQAQKVGKLKDKLDEANESAAAFSGNKFENMSASLSGMGSALRNLDFEKANVMAKAFATNMKAISFKEGTEGIKQLGSTFATMGKALLTNPYFLLAAVIGAIVLAIVKLLDKLGILDKIFKAVGDVVDVVVQKIKDFVDIFTGGALAAEDMANATIKSMEKSSISIKNRGDAVVAGYDTEIALAKLAGKNTDALEKKKVLALKETARQILNNSIIAYNAAISKGNLDRKEIDDLYEKIRLNKIAYTKASDDVKIADATITANQKKEATERAKAAKTAGDSAKQKRDEYNKTLLEAQRSVEDLRINLTKNGIEKELALNKVKYERLIADIVAKESKIKNVKDPLYIEYEKQKAFYEQQMADEAVKLAENTAKEIGDIRINYLNNEIEKTKAIRENAYKDEIDKLKKNLKDGKITQEEFNEFSKTAEDRKNKDIEVINKTAVDKKMADLKTENDVKIQYMQEGLDKQLALIQNSYANEKAELDKKLADGLISQQTYDDALLQLNKNKEDSLKKEKDKAAEEDKAREKDLQDKKYTAVSNGLSTIGNLAELFAGKSKKSQKAAFNVQKGVQIAQTTIDTYRSATGAYTSLVGIPVVGPALAIAGAAAAAAAGLLNVKKIAATKFDEGGGGGSVDTTSAPSAPSASISTGTVTNVAPTPSSLLTQTTNNSGNLSNNNGSTTTNNNEEKVIKAYVVESEMTDMQNRVKTYKNRSEIG